MMNKLLGGQIALLIGVAAAIALVLGAVTYVVQSRDNGGSAASISLRLHDEVVSWPNHSALQREAVATVNDESGQLEIRRRIDSADGLNSVEASSLGDPASIEIVATATDDVVAIAAVEAAADLAVEQSVLDRAAPIEAQLSSLKADMAVAAAERDALLSQLAAGIDDDAERAIAGASVESVAGVASVLEQDIARIEANINAKTAPLVAIGDATLITQSGNDLQAGLAAAVGAFFLSLLALSLLGDRESIGSNDQLIDLTSPQRTPEQDGAKAQAQRRPASVE